MQLEDPRKQLEINHALVVALKTVLSQRLIKHSYLFSSRTLAEKYGKKTAKKNAT
jgi:hypothetical protein